MVFDLPDHANASFDAQARLFSNDLKAITQTASLTGVKSGCGVTAQGSPNMTVAVASGVCYFLNAEVVVSAGNETITTAHATWPRIDIVVVNSSGVKSVVAGTAAEFPIEPATPSNSIMLAQVYVPANDTAIGATQIRDRGITLQIPSVAGAPSTIVRKTAPESVTSNTTLQDDDHLFFPMHSNGVWSVKMFVVAITANAGGTSAFKFNFSGPSGATWRFIASMRLGHLITYTPTSADMLLTVGTTPEPIVFDGIVTTSSTSGDFRFRWAQSGSSTFANTIEANSHLEYRALA